MRGVTSAAVMQLKVRYVVRDVDRHGNVRFYVRRKGMPKVRLTEKPGTEAFLREYHMVLSRGEPSVAPPTSPPTGTYRWLCEQYCRSAAFKRLAPSTRQQRRSALEATYAEPLKPGDSVTFAEMPLAAVTTRALRVLRDRRADALGAASDRVKAIRAAFKWGLAEDIIASNPAAGLEKLPMPGEGLHTWTSEEMERFRERHPPDSTARLALELLLLTGARRSDAIILGRQHCHGGWLRWVQTKNAKRKPITTEIPMRRELQAALEACKVAGQRTFLVNPSSGRSFTSDAFGAWFRDRCLEAGLAHCSAHGLRKAAAVLAAESGATTRQLMAWFGWLTHGEAERYTRAAERKKLAGDMGKLVGHGK